MAIVFGVFAAERFAARPSPICFVRSLVASGCDGGLIDIQKLSERAQIEFRFTSCTLDFVFKLHIVFCSMRFFVLSAQPLVHNVSFSYILNTPRTGEDQTEI